MTRDNRFPLFCGLVAASFAASGQAQDSATVGGELDEIMVTASATRVVRDGYDAPTPTTVVGNEQLEKLAPGMMIEAIAELPSMRDVDTPSTVGAANTGNRGASFANMRGLGPNRTLVLINGQRIVPTTALGAVDLSLIPTAFLRSVEVVTGGASAAWGSDAVAGVINFVHDTAFEGVKGDVQYGVTRYDDGEDLKVSLTAGTHFADDRAHLLVSGEYFDSKGVESNYDYSLRGEINPRKHARQHHSIINNPAWAPGNGEPQRILLPYVYQATGTKGGMINAGPLRWTAFLPDGQTTTLTPGVVSGTLMAMPDYSEHLGPIELIRGASHYGMLKAPVERSSLFGRFSYDLTSTTTLTVDALNSKSYSWGNSAPLYTPIGGALVIRNDNAFLSQDVKDRMATAGVTSFTLGRYSDDIGAAVMTADSEVKRYSVALDGRLTDTWAFNTHVQHGISSSVIEYRDNLIRDNVHRAVDAVFDPDGRIVCRSTLTNPDNGCVPLNLFGYGAPSMAAMDYIHADAYAMVEYTQTSGAFTVNGEPFSFNGTPVSVAAGVEYRKEEVEQTVDPLSQALAYTYAGRQAMAGDMSALEGFAEAVVTLAKDRPLVESLDVNAAVRVTDYSVSGAIETWKVGMNYSPIADLRIRATVSKDNRAPNLQELYTNPIQQSVTVNDPFLNTTGNSAQSLTSGSTALQPETADTYALGFVYRPSWLNGFSMSVDYYQIEIASGISTLTAQEIVDRCFAGNTALCDLIQRDPSTGLITFVTIPYLNLASEETSGIDMEFSYQTDLSAFSPSLRGGLTLRALGNYVREATRNDGVTSEDNANSLIDGQPKWMWKFVAGYSLDSFSTTLEANYVGGGKYDGQWTNLDFRENDVGSYTLFHLGSEYKMRTRAGELTAYLAIRNLLDRDPPRQFENTTSSYDRIGRTFRGGFRFNF